MIVISGGLDVSAPRLATNSCIFGSPKNCWNCSPFPLVDDLHESVTYTEPVVDGTRRLGSGSAGLQLIGALGHRLPNAAVSPETFMTTRTLMCPPQASQSGVSPASSQVAPTLSLLH